MIEVVSRKYFNQFSNGVGLNLNQSVFTHYPLTWVRGKYKRITEVDVFATSLADGEAWELTANTITRLTGSFIDDGFVIGDRVQVESQSTDFGLGFITNITDLVITTDHGTFPVGTGTTIIIYLATKQLGINYFSNTGENNDPASYVSRVDESSDRKFTVELTEAEYDANTEVAGTAIGLVLSWKQDTFSAKNTAAPSAANGWRQRFQLIEIFTVTPFFDTIANLEGGIQPPEYAGSNSIRHIIRVETIPTILNPIIVHQLEDTDAPQTFGTGAYYDERFNGLTPIEFTKDTITYLDGATSVNQLLVDKTITFTAKVDSLSGVFSAGNTQYQLTIGFLNDGVLDPTKTVEENFVMDDVFATADGGVNAGVNGIFSNVTGTITGGQLVITGDVTYTSAQQLLIDGGQYVLAVATNDHTTAIDQSLLVNVILDVNDYDRDLDVPDLIGVTSALFYEHPFDKGTGGTTDFNGWSEDGILYSVDWFLDLLKEAVGIDMEVRLVAFNASTGDFFTFDTTTFDFTSAIVSGGVQQIAVNTTRGFRLETTTPSQFNLVRITTESLIGDEQHYCLDLGMKIHWMDWIAQATAHPSFFDNTKLNNGLNQEIANYSAANGYAIKVFIDANVQAPNPLGEGTVVTKTRFRSPDMRIFAYENDDTGSPSIFWGRLIETFNQAATSLVGEVHGSENTKVKITYTLLTGSITSSTIYTIIRIEEYQQGALLGIHELSSKRLSAANNILIPLTGETKTKNTVGATTVISECQIDYTKLNPSSKYKISGRIGSEDQIAPPLFNYKRKTDGTIKQKTDGTQKAKA